MGRSRNGLGACVVMAVAIALGGWLTFAAQQVTSHTLRFEGRPRIYHFQAPATAVPGPVPLVVLLHGRGDRGRTFLSAWRTVAREQGFALVAPDSFGEGWALSDDGPDFFQALLEAVKKQAAIDGRRVYLFGHSSGGHQALTLGPLESEYFAAVAVHAGALNPSERIFLDQARRKIPVGFWHGKADRVISLQMAQDTRDMFVSLNFPVTFTEISSHAHDYYSRAARINNEVWSFLKSHGLSAEPVYRPYAIGKW